jgi:hypothetical protein
MRMLGFRFNIFINLIRALFPRWNFFDRVGHHFEIEIKIKDSSVWQKISFEQERRSFSLFVNPMMNLALAQVNIIEHFVSDLGDLQKVRAEIESREIQALTTFKMLLALLQVKMKDFEIGPAAFQFKILACSPSEKSDVYISDWIFGANR